MDWNEQVAVVTGGSRGIGAAIFRRLAARGAAVGINYVAHSREAGFDGRLARHRGGARGDRYGR
jgi:NAD(P)-dependent dehydrogenase (short-subunit alcohol dehydrogenase family)